MRVITLAMITLAIALLAGCTGDSEDYGYYVSLSATRPDSRCQYLGSVSTSQRPSSPAPIPDRHDSDWRNPAASPSGKQRILFASSLDLRQRAARLGGNTLYNVNISPGQPSTTSFGTISGDVYRCP